MPKVIELDAVVRKFTADGVNLYVGEVVDSSKYAYTNQLRTHRFLTPFNGEPLKCEHCGRMFTGDEIKAQHVLQDHPEAELPSQDSEEGVEKEIA